MSNNEREIEEEIQAKGLNAPRLSPEIDALTRDFTSLKKPSTSGTSRDRCYGISC